MIKKILIKLGHPIYRILNLTISLFIKSLGEIKTDLNNDISKLIKNIFALVKKDNLINKNKDIFFKKLEERKLKEREISLNKIEEKNSLLNKLKNTFLNKKDLVNKYRETFFK